VRNAWQFVFNQGKTGSVWAATKNIIYVAQPNAPVDFPFPFFPIYLLPFSSTRCVLALYAQIYIYIYLYTFIHIYICNTTRHRPLRVLQLDAVLIAEENPC